MAKKTFYFPHDGNARNDDKIIAVRMRYKMEGYGVYFAILERLLESSDYMCVKDYTIIAFDLRVSSEIVKSIVEDFSLFNLTEDGKHFYSNNFIERMKPLENLREQRSLAGKKSAEKRAKKSEDSTSDERSLTENATKESKVDKSKEKKIINNPKGYEKFDFEFLENNLKDCFLMWIDHKRESGKTYKTQQSLELCYKQLKEKSQNNPSIARQIVEQSIGSNYEGLFELRQRSDNYNGNSLSYMLSKPDYSIEM